MNIKTFNTLNNEELIIKSLRSSIIFETNEENPMKLKYNFIFSNEVLKDIYDTLNKMGILIWKEITPKEATSEGSDYYEYYDRELDNNGYLEIFSSSLIIERPSVESKRLYKFNKSKFQSFIYDLEKALNN